MRTGTAHRAAAGALLAVCGLLAANGLARHWSEPTRQESACDAIRAELATAEDYLATLDRESTSEAVAVNAGTMTAGTLHDVSRRMHAAIAGGRPDPDTAGEVLDYTDALGQLQGSLWTRQNDRALQARLELIGDAEDIRFHCAEYDR